MNWQDKFDWEENHRLACIFREKKRKEFLDGKLPKDQEFILKHIDRKVRLWAEEPLSFAVRFKLLLN